MRESLPAEGTHLAHAGDEMAISEFRPNKTGAAVLALLAGISCGRLVDPPLPADAALFVPPPVYARWWAMVEECSGLRGSLDKIQWYSAPEELSNPDNSGDRVEAYWSRASNRIVLSRNRTIDGAVVRHENAARPGTLWGTPEAQIPSGLRWGRFVPRCVRP